ncbi:hypothetical protein GW793_02285 [bacterium]|uniref:Uncharacterized protein n=2 Tax=Katanobacteria TaxID=422282 RepID=A0A2M7X0N8_UNCKA|nr:hypothetical protein [bacterium]PIP57011.1 MAG: hypothetical protein COX05_00190 [candidate division WWE3 bacterium CG22_combo_CG10-13_8_21_14_all_39_12]PJA39694.1 MAG: hypothetical protein CO179_04705 [candidate division WWE3 bacterium CG_4_9_14_3_um_filter_39_7]
MEESSVITFLSKITGNTLSTKTLTYILIVALLCIGAYTIYTFSSSFSRISPHKNTSVELIPNQEQEYKQYQ